ncbi:hypothetical protein MKW92_032805 [Papaver armeniacum]|nr:hypothetical protein MKW92_032805 [Papaver armeniacum]
MNAAASAGVKSLYEFHKELAKCGKDAGAVYLCEEKVTHEYVACKSLNKKSRAYDADDINNEINIMKKLTHPNVVDLKQVFEDDEHVDIVMEYCPGHDLFDRLVDIERFTESNAKIVFKQLSGVVKSCHDEGIVHRDIKLENIFLTKKDNQCLDIKLGDFGFATYIKPGEKLNEFSGTLPYMAPEMLDRNHRSYDQAVDLWSAGVVLFELLTGTRAFDGETKSHIVNKIKDVNLSFDPSLWNNISESAKDMVTGMLCKDPTERLTATEVLNHPWMK